MTFYFYDLETSGISSRAQRIMQFAGQRTDMDLNPIGEPDNWLVKLTEEILPDPEAVLITGITPQQTLQEGYTEAEFLELFTERVCQPDTIITGFNSIRFDDEFMRNTMWRNFYDAYEWQWQDGRSRWDLLDVVRMVRALRPQGIEWPEVNGVATNRLELLTKLNNLSHEQAHDALSDVYATIAVAKMLKEKQPRMFEYLLQLRDKKAVVALAQPSNPQPFLYTSGRYSGKWHKTTAVACVGEAEHNALLVYDLRIDPKQYASLSDEELSNVLFTRDQQTELLPVKALKPNACPAVAPLGVLDEAAENNIQLTKQTISENFQTLYKLPGFCERITALHKNFASQKRSQYDKKTDPDFQLYDGFIGGSDKQHIQAARAADAKSLSDFSPTFTDSRLAPLLTRYKARNYSSSLQPQERDEWEEYRTERIIQGTDGQLSVTEYANKLAELAKTHTGENEQFLLQELQLYAESIVPIPDM